MPAAIPVYPASRTIEITDAELLREHLRILQPSISELSFANLYLFRHAHHYELTCMDNSLVVLGCGYDGIPNFLPPISGNRGDTARKLLDKEKTLYGADGPFVAEHLGDRGYSVFPDRDNDDYLYLRSDLAELPGNRFHRKKNRINYFTSRWKYSIEPFSAMHVESALQLVEEWWNVHMEEGNRTMTAEKEATCEGLRLADELGLTGVAMLTDRGVSAFALGERLNDSTTVCHFEKADPFLTGAAQLVNREFCRSQPAEITFINREQDLGESGLRQAKSSYCPVAMINKFRVIL